MASVTHLQDNTFLARDSHGHAVLIDADAHGASCPTELLVMALGACCSTDLLNGLSEAGGIVTFCQVTTHETLREAEPRIYTDIELVFDIRAQGVSEALVSQVLQTALRRQCHVCLMLGGSIRLSSRFTLNAG